MLFTSLMAKAVPYCDIRKFSINDGLAANTVADMKQGYDNLLWFATWNGLSYYDGYKFHTFRDEPDKTDVLSTNRLLFIEPSYNNNIWTVTHDRQLYIYDTHDCNFMNLGKYINEKYNIDLRVDRIFPTKKATWISDVSGKYLLRTNKSVSATDYQIEFIKSGEKGFRGGKVWFIRADSQGREWVLTEKGTFIYGNKFNTKIPFKWIRWVGDDTFLATVDGKLAMYDEQNRLTMIPMPEGVTRINELKNTGYQLLIATNVGLVTYNPRTFKFETINVQHPSQPMAEVTSIYTDDFGMVWAFTDGMGVTIINPKTGYKQWLFADQDDPDNRTTSDRPFITQDEHKTLWVVPNGGTFSYYDRKVGKLVPYLLRSNSSGNYRIPSISKHLLSDQGILWITGRHDLTQVAFKYHPYVVNKIDKGEDEVRSVSASPNGNIWAGYWSGFIQVMNSQHQQLGYLSPSGQIVPQQIKFSPKGIYALFFDIKGRAWIGTNGDGLYVLSGGQTRHFTFDPKISSSLPNDNIYDIEADRSGKIWIGTYGGGLALVKESPDGGISFVSKRNGLPWEKNHFEKVRRICCTTTGNILVGTTDGLITFSDTFVHPSQIKHFKSCYTEGDTTTLECSDVNFIMEHTDGRMLISELGGTMEQIVSKTPLENNLKVKYFHQISPSEGIVQSMVEDNQGRIWIIRESSIDCVNLKTRQTEVYGPNDFDLNMSFSEAKPYHDPASNNISVGTPMGLLTFNPSNMKKSLYQPKIVFCDVHFSAGNTTEPILHKEKLVIPANKRTLTITFASLDYQRKYQTKYLYRIDGITAPGEWIPNGTSNTIGFNHINHGTYVLKVRATNSHGVWSKYIGELQLEVRPTFWESLWGKAALILLLSVIIGTIVYTYYQRQRENLSHEMSVLKNDFFSDAAHRLRTPLTLIGGPVHTVLETENGLTRNGKELLKIVEKNSNEMLEMLNKMLRYDNTGNFYTNSGIAAEDSNHTEKENIKGQVDDSNVSTYLKEVKEEKDTEEEQLSQQGLEKRDVHKNVTILVVEDNEDLRRYLYNILQESYNVLLAENGKAGLLMTRKEMPDFILTDVTMPVMDGLQMIHEIKEDSALATIPVVVLSAKASLEDQQKGYAEGIDGYLTKPFSTAYLLGRIEAIINKRRQLQADVIRKLKAAGDKDAIAAFRFMPAAPTTHQSTGANGPQAAKPTKEQQIQDYEFMSVQVNDKSTQRILKFVTENLGNPDLKIDDIANETGMSRSVLYNKVKNAVGMTPIDFVRHLRIMKASEMLRNTDDSLTSIAFSVGFSDPKYFSKVFKKEMGIIPSEYRERTQG